MICSYCGTILYYREPHSRDSEGGTRCFAHPEERDTLTRAEDELAHLDGEIARLEERLGVVKGKRMVVWVVFCAALKEFQRQS